MWEDGNELDLDLYHVQSGEISFSPFMTAIPGTSLTHHGSWAKQGALNVTG